MWLLGGAESGVAAGLLPKDLGRVRRALYQVESTAVKASGTVGLHTRKSGLLFCSFVGPGKGRVILMKLPVLEA